MLQGGTSRELSTTPACRLVSGLDTPPQNGFYVRSAGYVSQNIPTGKTESLRLLQRDYAKDR